MNRNRLNGGVPVCRSVLTLPYAAVAVALLTGAAEAADDAGWQYELTPYVWAAGLDGRVKLTDLQKTNGIAVDQSFSDILERLDFGLMGAFEARNGRWGLLLDGVYFKVSDEGNLRENKVIPLNAKGTVTQQMYAVAGAFRVNEGPHVFDLIGGLRYNSVKWDVNVAPSVPIIPTFKETKDWLDPYIGVRVQHPLGDRLTVEGYADVGGFGVGSDLSWQASAGINYSFTPSMTGKFGYRHVDNDYSEDGFTYDMASSGIYAGLGIRW